MPTIRVNNIIERRRYIVNYEVLNDEGVTIRDPVFICDAADETECKEKFKMHINEHDPLAVLTTNLLQRLAYENTDFATAFEIADPP